MDRRSLVCTDFHSHSQWSEERLLLPDRVQRQVDPAALVQMVLVGGGLAVAAEPEPLDGALLGDEGDAPRERAYAAVLAPALRDAGHARQRGSAEPWLSKRLD